MIAAGPSCSTIGNIAWKVSQEMIALLSRRSSTDLAACINDRTGFRTNHSSAAPCWPDCAALRPADASR